MSGWPQLAIREVVRPVGTHNPARASASAEFVYIDLSAVDQDRKVISSARQMACSDAPSRARQLIAYDDVLVSTVRPNLNGVARVPPEMDGATASTGFCVLRAEVARIDVAYLFQWVKGPAFVADMVLKATGASYPAVSDRIVLDSFIPLPPLLEQRRIAEVLDRADALRAKRRAALAQLDSLIKSIFLNMFGDPAINPKQLPRIDLGSLVVDGFQNGLYKHSSAYGSGIPILRIDAFYDGVVSRLSTLKRLSISPVELETYGLHEGDVVINRVNSMEYLGKSAIIPSLAEPIVFESNIMRFRINHEIALPSYVVAFLQSGFIKGQIGVSAKQAVNQASINQKDVAGLRINVPPLALQQAFTHRIRVIEALKAAHCAALTELDALFASLQHRAFRGEL